jgi:hypothetical protein
MKKVNEQQLKDKIKSIIQDSTEPESDIVNLLKGLQDASGVKICQNTNADDAAYKEVE